jgi:deoxycytidylate deaminase
VAVHAEERVIIHNRELARGAHLVHAAVDRMGKLRVSGHPSCWQCSRMMVEAEIAWVWLFQADGWIPFRADRFHELTLIGNDLPFERAG